MDVVSLLPAFKTAGLADGEDEALALMLQAAAYPLPTAATALPEDLRFAGRPPLH